VHHDAQTGDQPEIPNASILTIGHSTLPVEDFVANLQRHRVTAIADVRSSPYSGFNPSFNRESLSAILKSYGIAYVFLGKELGGRPSDSQCYENGRVSYEKVAHMKWFHSAVERLLKGTQSHNIALMCTEQEPLACHRTLLIARALKARAVLVGHIHSSGALESHQEAENRLVHVSGFSAADFFRTEDETLALAYATQEQRVAYRVPRDSATEDLAR